jgi:hypothetical protein
MAVTKKLERAGVDAPLANFVEKAMAHDRNDRFPSASQMLKALEEFEPASPVVTEPVQIRQPRAATSPITSTGRPQLVQVVHTWVNSVGMEWRFLKP